MFYKETCTSLVINNNNYNVHYMLFGFKGYRFLSSNVLFKNFSLLSEGFSKQINVSCFFSTKNYIVDNNSSNIKIHPSFNSILNDKSKGGILLSKVIYLLHDQNKLNIPLYLTAKGIKASQDLINMINLLPEKNNSYFKGDNILYEFLNKNYNKIFRFNIHLSLKKLIPNITYDLPIKNQKVIDGDCSGIYCFIDEKTGNVGIGSAISCKNRLKDHMNSFNGHRSKSYLHEWVLENGGITSIKWAPIITYDNIIQDWYNINYVLSLSKGGAKILQGFGQYVSRILEQCLYTQYKPFFNIKNKELKDIIFFNFGFEANEMLLSLDEASEYQAWLDIEGTKLFAESNSLNSLAKLLNVTVGTVRNNMNWDKGITIINDKSEKIIVYLKEKGVSFRSELLESQMKPRDKYSLLELKDKSLYDLIPGKIYAINVSTLEIFGIYKNQRDLWKNLNPNYNEELENLTLNKQRSFLDNRIGRYFNIKKPGGVKTELGNFYICKHPDYLPGLTKKASGLFAVDIYTGLAVYYSNNSKAGDRGTVRRNRNNNTVTKNGLRYINEDIFIVNYPDAETKVNATYKLNKKQLANLPNNPPV